MRQAPLELSAHSAHTGRRAQRPTPFAGGGHRTGGSRDRHFARCNAHLHSFCPRSGKPTDSQNNYRSPFQTPPYARMKSFCGPSTPPSARIPAMLPGQSPSWLLLPDAWRRCISLASVSRRECVLGGVTAKLRLLDRPIWSHFPTLTFSWPLPFTVGVWLSICP